MEESARRKTFSDDLDQRRALCDDITYGARANASPFERRECRGRQRFVERDQKTARCLRIVEQMTEFLGDAGREYRATFDEGARGDLER